MEGFFLVTTDHLEDGLWFRDEEDFKTGMNLVAVQAHHSPVKVLAFILMSNHLHFVLSCEWEEARRFIEGLKHRFSKYLSRKYGCLRQLRRNGVDIRKVPEEDEALEKAIAYVQMNCVAANICSHPSQYPWGTGNVFFRATPAQGIPLASLSKRARCHLIHSWSPSLPAHLLVHEDYLLPDSYVQTRFTEALFRTARRMNYFLMSSSKAKVRLESSQDSLPAFRDQIILSAIPDLCQSLFRKPSFANLSEGQKRELLRQIRYRFCANVHQIARVCGMTYADAADMLERD